MGNKFPQLINTFPFLNALVWPFRQAQQPNEKYRSFMRKGVKHHHCMCPCSSIRKGEKKPEGNKLNGWAPCVTWFEECCSRYGVTVAFFRPMHTVGIVRCRTKKVCVDRSGSQIGVLHAAWTQICGLPKHRRVPKSSIVRCVIDRADCQLCKC